MMVANGMRICAVIPVYNHETAVGDVVGGLLSAGLDCLLVNDGSNAVCTQVLDGLAAAHGGAVRALHRVANGGKGAAVVDGLREAGRLGYTHVLQVDADGQHALTDIPVFLEAAARSPDALVCGRPDFDVSMPRARRYGRYLTHVWVWINTLSFDIPDSMCGFRVYPLRSVLAMLDDERVGLRMDFDIEVLVRLHWRGVRMLWLPTRVTYPSDGISHFRVFLDNFLITRVHTRLFFGMVRRLPRLLTTRKKHA
jgi:glycosyltransferase involved in cell wall biosynthesis